jgi:hypothetical protein
MPDQAPRSKDCIAVMIWKLSPLSGSRNRLMRPCHVREHEIRAQHSCDRDAAEPRHDEGGDACQEEQRAPYGDEQDGLAKVRFRHEQRHRDDEKHKRQHPAGNVGPAAAFGEQPGRDDDEGRLHELRRLHRNATEEEPAPGSFDLLPDEQDEHHEHQADGKLNQSGAAHLARVQERQPYHDDRRHRRIHAVAHDKVQRIEADALGNGRARGE